MHMEEIIWGIPIIGIAVLKCIHTLHLHYHEILLSKMVISIYCLKSIILALHTHHNLIHFQFSSASIFSKESYIVLICISKISSVVEHSFICLLDVHISSNINHPFYIFKSFFPIDLLIFFLLICRSFLGNQCFKT